MRKNDSSIHKGKDPAYNIGFWECSHCGYIDDIEREIKCWACGKGEMRFRHFSQIVYENRRMKALLDDFLKNGGYLDTISPGDLKRIESLFEEFKHYTAVIELVMRREFTD